MASRQAQRWRNGDDGPVGLVVAGGGARGAYETGVLSVLLPELARQGRRPTVFVGTSAGAINAALFASLAHLPAEEAAGVALDRWRSVHQQMVIKPAWQTLPPLGLRYAAAMVGVPGQLTGLLDTGPLASSLNRNQLIDWGQIGFFEPAFMDAAIELGRRDAEALLRQPPLWKEAEFPPKPVTRPDQAP